MATYELIGSVTVGAGGASSIDFTSIPGTYTDLVLKISARGSTSSIFGEIRFNSTTTNYSSKRIEGDGSTAYSSNRTDNFFEIVNASTYTTNTFNSVEFYIPNYAGSAQKSFSIDAVTENNASTAIATVWAGLWANTAAITSISLVPQTATFVQYSTAYLYGVKNA